MRLMDTHCHIHEVLGDGGVAEKWRKNGITDANELINSAAKAGVHQLMIVGCSFEDSALAVKFVQDRDKCWASIGIHPHEATQYIGNQAVLDRFAALANEPKVQSVGECGLDYYYTHSAPEEQAAILKFQLGLAQTHDLPLIFHVRDAFEDFWRLFDQYSGLQGVVHSFTATEKELQAALDRGLYIGLNGIMTFTKDATQLAAARRVPLDRLVLETDAPFLTPAPFRGKVNKPEYVLETARFLADLREESLEELAAATTANANWLFRIR